MKLITVVVPCYNEVQNIKLIFEAIDKEFSKIIGFKYDILFIDNFSTDGTRDALRALAKTNSQIRVIFNNTNYGPVRSPFYGLLQSRADATILMAADFQEPPDLIPEFIKHWEAGNKVVAGIKKTSQEPSIKFRVRGYYYKLLSYLSETPLITQFTGFALYDKQVIHEFVKCNDPYPYLRGLVSELGFKPFEVSYHQPSRMFGEAKGTLKNMINFGLLGVVTHSKIPLRLSIYIGMVTSILSFLTAVIYFFYKLIFWSSFQLGMAPLLIGLSFFSSVQLFFLGVVGEYVGATLTHVKSRPLVIEQERINF